MKEGLGERRGEEGGGGGGDGGREGEGGREGADGRIEEGRERMRMRKKWRMVGRG